MNQLHPNETNLTLPRVENKVLIYFHFVCVSISQLVNALLGGWPDETLCSRLYRLKQTNGHWFYHLAVWFFNAIFFYEVEHCFIAYMDEINHRHLPRDYTLKHHDHQEN